MIDRPNPIDLQDARIARLKDQNTEAWRAVIVELEKRQSAERHLAFWRRVGISTICAEVGRLIWWWFS